MEPKRWFSSINTMLFNNIQWCIIIQWDRVRDRQNWDKEWWGQQTEIGTEVPKKWGEDSLSSTASLTSLQPAAKIPPGAAGGNGAVLTPIANLSALPRPIYGWPIPSPPGLHICIIHAYSLNTNCLYSTNGLSKFLKKWMPILILNFGGILTYT